MLVLRGGIQQLAVHYLGIDFAKEQRELLAQTEVELIFIIDEGGKPTLSEVNGIADSAILDSLTQRTASLPYFNPKVRSSKPESSIYFLLLEYPSYERLSLETTMPMTFMWQELKLSDFESIEKTTSRMDIVIGALTNTFVGDIGEHVGFGGGMKIDMTYTDNSHRVYGLIMDIYGNRLKQPFDLTTDREQFGYPPTLVIGGTFGKWYNRYLIQAEVGYTIQNLTERRGSNDDDWVQLRGWSPGITIHRPLQLGSDRFGNYYGSPSVWNHNLSISAGLRYIDLNHPNANGLMVELGLSYRLAYFGVKSYTLKK